jgi:hypothetical protein
MRKQRSSASDLRDHVDAFPPEYVRTICDDFWNFSNQNSVERKKYASRIIEFHQQIGSNDRCLFEEP